ncbi:glycosyl hydrolase family 8, partial [Salmonella enterica subsp. enterica serovar Montevideo]|nr:glycosyl hydrolase family 8 [Salmonella enterica subsp. enterica serovar Montevideo]
DIWMAWSLLEAGRLWKETRYTEVGTALLKRIAREEVVNVPGLEGGPESFASQIGTSGAP